MEERSFSQFSCLAYFLSKWIFVVSLVLLLILYFLELAKEGSVSFYFNLNYLIALVFVSGVITVFSSEKGECNDNESIFFSKNKRMFFIGSVIFFGAIFLGWILNNNFSSKVNFTYRGFGDYVSMGEVFLNKSLLHGLSRVDAKETDPIPLFKINKVVNGTSDSYKEGEIFSVLKDSKAIVFDLENVGFFDKFQINLSGFDGNWDAGLVSVERGVCDIFGVNSRGFRGGTILKVNGDEYFYVVRDKLEIRRLDMEIEELRDFVLGSDLLEVGKDYDLSFYERGETISDLAAILDGVFVSLNRDGILVRYYLSDDEKRVVPDDIFETFYKEKKFPEVKNINLLSGYNESVLKYPIGTPFEFNGAIYIVISKDNWMKISSPDVFTGRGNDWSEVVKIDPNRAGWYQSLGVIDNTALQYSGGITYLEDRDEYYYKEECGYSKLLGGREVVDSYFFNKKILTTNGEELKKYKVQVATAYNNEIKEVRVDEDYFSEKENYLFFIVFEEPLSEDTDINGLKVTGYREGFLKRVFAKLGLN